MTDLTGIESCFSSLGQITPGFINIMTTITVIIITNNVSIVFLDASEGPYTQDFEALQDMVLCALDRYCRARFPEEPSRYGKVLLKLMYLKSVIADDIETLVFSKLFPHSSVSGFIRNHLATEAAMAEQRLSPAKETTT